nr:MAG TPA: Minor capsid protein [Caudoviricetes sp.]
MEIKGITVTLYQTVKTGSDGFGSDIFEEQAAQVEDVLVALASADDVINSVQLEGKKAVYLLGIPKGDTHEWEDKTIEFFGKKFRSFGPVQEGIEELVPTRWHKKVTVERYE